MEKSIIISHRSALSVIRILRSRENIAQEGYDLTTGKSIIEFLPKPVDITVASVNDFRNNRKYKFHLSPKIWKLKPLIKIEKNIFCTKPEYVIMQLSSKLSFEELFLLWCELCGTYTISEQNESFVPSVKPATSMSKLKAAYNKHKNINPYFNGSKLFRHVFKYAADGSASPMETKMYLKLCGPRKRGFYGCKNLSFNKQIKLGNHARKIAGQEIVIPDICSIKHKVAIEYDSTQFHTSTDRSQKDKLRRDALVLEGWKVHTVTPAILNDPYRFNVVASSVLTDIKQSSRIRVNNFESIRNEAFTLL